jgi:large subunit ribosomal protein L15
MADADNAVPPGDAPAEPGYPGTGATAEQADEAPAPAAAPAGPGAGASADLTPAGSGDAAAEADAADDAEHADDADDADDAADAADAAEADDAEHADDAAAEAAAPDQPVPGTGGADAAPAKPTAPAAADTDAEHASGAAALSGRAGLKLHHLRPAPGARRAKTRLGRGEASKGKSAGRGTKGTKARDTVPVRFEGGQMPLHRRVPKRRGFSNIKFKTTYQVVNLDRLAALYPQGGEVTPGDLVARGAVRNGELVKVLGSGDVGIALRVTAHAFSTSAKEKIAAAGGTATEI